jgi:MYXO-CTERM domain-containing protein
MKVMLRGSLAGLVSCFLLSLSATALAEGEACFNDDDCPGGGAVCGGDVCNWNKLSATPDGDKIFFCNPAGTGVKGSDGWCTDSTDCKCAMQGATCRGTYCSFTKASDAPAPSGGGGAGGSAAGGSAAGGGGSAAGGAPAAGAATGGSSPVAGSTSTAGGSTTPPPATDSGGCSVSVPGNTGTGALLALGVAGLGLALARRRR